MECKKMREIENMLKTLLKPDAEHLHAALFKPLEHFAHILVSTQSMQSYER